MTVHDDQKIINRQWIASDGINEQTMRPDFEKPIICPRCGERTIDDVLLTELGQSQMTEATWDI